MDPELPPELLAERDALVAEVYAAFEGVGREGGVSWSEAWVLDDFGSDERQAAARASDTEAGWEDLVEPWEGCDGSGGWSFLDPIGFRYYLPPQMVASIREGDDRGVFGVAFPLTVEVEWLSPEENRDRKEGRMRLFSLLDDRQRRCVRRFLRYMETVARLREDRLAGWTEALNAYWRSLPDVGSAS